MRRHKEDEKEGAVVKEHVEAVAERHCTAF